VRGSLPHKEGQASRPYAKNDDICDIDDIGDTILLGKKILASKGLSGYFI
jgi:hypothetical protein